MMNDYDNPLGDWIQKDIEANPVTKTLLDQAYDLLTVKVADEPYGDGVDPNDYRAVLQKWVADYEEAKKRAQDYVAWIEAK